MRRAIGHEDQPPSELSRREGAPPRPETESVIGSAGSRNLVTQAFRDPEARDVSPCWRDRHALAIHDDVALGSTSTSLPALTPRPLALCSTIGNSSRSFFIARNTWGINDSTPIVALLGLYGSRVALSEDCIALTLASRKPHQSGVSAVSGTTTCTAPGTTSTSMGVWPTISPSACTGRGRLLRIRIVRSAWR